jgi:8-oxo-dGTP diphosphatase
VVGFLFTPYETHLVLIQKNRPPWQAGKYNGLGGKIAPGEAPHAAMVREFKEEAGLDIPEWQHRAILKGALWELNVFVARSNMALQARTMTDERVMIVDPYRLYDYPVLPNVPMLVALCLDTSGLKFPVTMEEA